MKTALVYLSILLSAAAAQSQDPLPSWNDTAPKKAIVAFVEKVTKEGKRNYVSSTFLQPFVSYSTKTKTTFSLNAESTYDWHNKQWTVPVNLSVNQLTKIGKLPLQFALGGKVYAEGPSGAPEWGIRFTITPLFPTGGRPSAQQSNYSK